MLILSPFLLHFFLSLSHSTIDSADIATQHKMIYAVKHTIIHQREPCTRTGERRTMSENVLHLLRQPERTAHTRQNKNKNKMNEKKQERQRKFSSLLINLIYAILCSTLHFNEVERRRSRAKKKERAEIKISCFMWDCFVVKLCKLGLFLCCFTSFPPVSLSFFHFRDVERGKEHSRIATSRERGRVRWDNTKMVITTSKEVESWEFISLGAQPVSVEVRDCIIFS